MNCEQNYLGEKGLILFIAFLTTITPLSIDMYLPALPGMTDFFSTSESLVNLTIICYFLFYAISMLFWGPISDKHGRKKILLLCLILYASGSILGIISPTIHFLVGFRCLQAIGAGGISAVAMAIVKDSFEGRKREVTLAIVQSMMFLGPIIAPVVGGIILMYATWQWVFVLLSLAAIISIVATLFFQETLEIKKRNKGNTFASLKTLVVVLKNPRFSILLFMFSLLGLPFFAYLSTVSYIYQNKFGLNEQQFSYFFSIIAVVALMGPILYLKISKHVSVNAIIYASFIIFTVSGVCIFFLGHISAVVFIVVYAPNAIINSFLRPPATNLMLEQAPDYAGAASSLMGFCAILFGCAGMVFTSVLNLGYIELIGIETFFVGVIVLMLWHKNAKHYC